MFFFAVFAEMLFECQFLAFLNIVFLLHQSAVAPNVLLAQVLRDALDCMFVEDSPSLPLFFIEIEGIDHDTIQDDLLDLVIDHLFLHTLEALSLNKLIVFGLEAMLIFLWHSGRGQQIEEHCKYRPHSVYQLLPALDAFRLMVINNVLNLMLKVAAEVMIVQVITTQRIGSLRRLPEDEWTCIDAQLIQH